MASTAPSKRQTHIDRLYALFRAPPSLVSVALQCAQAYMDRYFAASQLSAGLIHLGTPVTGAPGQYRYQLLADLLVQRLAQAQPTLLVEGYHVVMRRVREVYVPSAPSLAELEPLINQCAEQLLEAYSQRLQAWWGEPVPAFASRWAALSDGLLGLFCEAPAPPGVSPSEFAQWFPKKRLPPHDPSRDWSLPATLRMQTVHLRRAIQPAPKALMAPLLVLSHSPAQDGEQSVLFRPASGLHRLSRLEDVGPWLHACDTAQDQWFIAQAQGDPFDTLAASYLACQLREIEAIGPTFVRTPAQLVGMLNYITDPRRWFVDRLSPQQQQLRSALPLWLVHANAQDSLAYANLLQKLVRVSEQQGVTHFLDGIATLGAFAAQCMHACLAREPRASALTPGDIRITFERVTAAAVPVSGGFIAGEVDPVTVTLPELALENLAGFPHTAKAITLKGAPAPAWLTYDVLKACVQAADVGQAYPALLKRDLIDDTAQASRRRLLFSQQWRVQLPMLALTLKARGLQGLTRVGFERLNAAVQATPTARESMALWPLAFKADTHAAVDTVEGFFIIGPQAHANGPHLLYQPLFEPMLHEYQSLEALFEAIRIPGQLQDQVLTWMAPARQSIYANGGFREPHIRHFLPTDEFTVYAKPAPVQLEKHLAGGDPADQVFASVANSLVALADRQSVSNVEQRWARLKQAGWLLLGTLLPYLGGPLMLGGWLLQLADSVQQDIDGLGSDDGQTRSKALLDLLVNLMAVLAHQAAPQDPRHPLQLDSPVFAPLEKAAPIARVPERISTPAVFTAPGDWASAQDVVTPALQARISPLSLVTFSEPWPAALANAERRGPRQGLLYNRGAVPPQWQALVRGQQFRVRINQGRVRVISADGHTLGPWLKPLGGGQWDFDLGLRLRGGAADPIAAGSSQGARLKSLEEALRDAELKRHRASLAIEVAHGLISKPAGAISEQQRRQAVDSYQRALEDRVRYSQEELQTLKQLRALKPRPRYEEDLSAVLETIILTTQLLSTRIREQMDAINLRIMPLLESLSHESTEEAEADINRQAHLQLRQGMHEIAAVHDQAIRWRALEERCMKELAQVPKLGRDRVRAVTARLPARPSALELQTLQLTTLWGSAIDVGGPALDDDFFASMNETIDRARWASRSLADLDRVQTSVAERVELLESIDHIYTQTDDQIEFWRAMEPDKFDLEYLQKLQELLATLHLRVEQNLGELLQPAPEPAPEPSSTTRGEGQPRKKIIRTRNRDLFVARLSPPTELQHGETAEVGGGDGVPAGSFTQAEDGIWDLTQDTRPRPDSALLSLMNKAQQQLDDVDRVIASVEAMVLRAHDSASLQELLEAQARSRQWLADDLRRKLQGSDSTRLATVQQANARALENQLRAAVSRLRAAGLEARVRATRNRPMSQTDVAFLHEQHEVRIVRQGGRVQIRGTSNDYLQVYAVMDVHSGRPLCFAHFHYARSLGPDDHFTAAHLKTLEQERMGRQAQAEVEADAFARMRLGQTGRVQQTLEVHRAQIQLALARRLFFSVD